MKKYLLVILCTIFLVAVTGCGKKQVVCSATTDDQTLEVIADLDDNDIVTGVSMIFDFNNKEEAEEYCNTVKESVEDVVCSGTKVTIQDFDKVALEDQEEDSTGWVGDTKENFIKAGEEDGFTCK